MRLQQRGLTGHMARNAVAALQVIEAYPHDKYSPGFLLPGQSEGCVFHAHIATDVEGGNIRIVTVYTPRPWRVGRRVACEEDQVRCRICGGLLESRVTDVPFKIGDSSIVILRSLPVLQCRQCGDTELEQATMSRVDQLLAAVDGSAELEVIRYAA